MHILVFGDSGAYGAWDRESGWPARLRKALDEKRFSDPDFWCLLYNLGVSGDTSEGLARRIESEAKARTDPEEGTLIIISIGMNDSQYIHKTRSIRTPPERFRLNLEKILAAAKRFSDRVCFLGLIPVDQAKVDPIPWKPGKSYRNDCIRQTDDLIRSFCREKGLPFIDTFGSFRGRSDLLHSDGAHPNSGGHKLIFSLVREFLEKERIM